MIVDLVATGTRLRDLVAGHAPDSTAKTTLYLHLNPADLTDQPETADAGGVGVVEQIGPATLARIKCWLGHSRVTVRPVLDLTGSGSGSAVDAHDPPAWMREHVILRDAHCVFPGCTMEAPAAATSTTPPPTSPPSPADHPARPTPTTSPPSADDTTASRPSATGPTTATPPGYTWTAPTTDASASPATPPRPWSETGRGPARVRAGNEVLT